MKGILHNTKDKLVIMVVQETNKLYATGFNMRTESYTQVRLDTLEVTDYKTIFHYIKDKTLIALIAIYFKQQKGMTTAILSEIIGISVRTLHRYISDTEIKIPEINDII